MQIILLQIKTTYFYGCRFIAQPLLASIIILAITIHKNNVSQHWAAKLLQTCQVIAGSQWFLQCFSLNIHLNLKKKFSSRTKPWQLPEFTLDMWISWRYVYLIYEHRNGGWKGKKHYQAVMESKF